jgi:uncharacterized protein (TIGR00730 family)
MNTLSVLVYCGSRSGHDPRLLQAATRFGHEVGRAGHRLVYGGHHAGLMGAVSSACLQAGGRVLGILPDVLGGRETPPPGIELVRVPHMHARKQRMVDEADVIVALPGGVGTLDELFEQLTWRAIGVHRKPIGLLNVAGVMDGVPHMLQQLCAAGLVDASVVSSLIVSSDETQLLAQLVQQRETP